MPEQKSILLKISNVSKYFPGTKALDQVNLDVYEGEIHAICGENGAGKSTLMKILSGVYPHGSYEGEFYFAGEECQFSGVKDSERRGIRIIYQELTLVPQMTVADNIHLGGEPTKYGFINQNELYRATEKLLKSYNFDIPYNARVSSLGIGKQQMVEIAKALSGNARLLILDEPTSALTIEETNVLLNIIRDLKRKGVTCIYISHKLDEVFQIADRITVLRDGRVVGTQDAAEIDQNKVVSMMVGRELTGQYPPRDAKIGEVIFQVENWTVAKDSGAVRPVIRDVSFELRKGEILGIAGLMGSGRTELVQSIFGEYGKRLSGNMVLNGNQISVRSSQDAIHNGIALLTEDRKNTSLVLKHSILENSTIASLGELLRWKVIDRDKELSITHDYKDKLQIKAPSVHSIVNDLSGGNQQKVAIAKWLMTDPQILIMDEPTRGIDVGTKYEVYKLMNELTSQGVSIIMVSSELPEILGMSDRILVMREGSVAGIVDNQDVTEETIMLLATGAA
ncbi:MAG: sugar ABC transporter ATP-binding protein [Firmicutes bacterium]|nr:sugar ABC transporter ATP-binding protein [Bacillota bacterium]